MRYTLRWVAIGSCVGIATALLRPKEPQSVIATVLLIVALALATADRRG